MIVSYSEVSCFQRCEREYYYRYGLGLRPNNNSSAIDMGTFGHSMLEIFYKGIQQGLSRQEAFEKMQAQFPMPKAPKNTKLGLLAEDSLSFAKASAYVEKYAKEVDLAGVPLHVEQVFKFQIEKESDLWVGFTPDLIWQNDHGMAFVEDYKFTGRKWNNNQLSRYSQINLYILFLQMMGYNIDRGWIRFFNTSMTHSDNPFSKKFYDPTNDELEILKGDFLRAAYKVVEFKSLPVAAQRMLASRTLNYTLCQYCKFVEPCNIEAKGQDASRTLRANYKENTYGYES